MPAEPGGELFRVDLVRRGITAELGGQGAQDPAVDAAGVRLPGSAQGGEVGVSRAADGDVTGRGEVTDRSQAQKLSEIMTNYL